MGERRYLLRYRNELGVKSRERLVGFFEIRGVMRLKRRGGRRDVGCWGWREVGRGFWRLAGAGDWWGDWGAGDGLRARAFDAEHAAEAVQMATEMGIFGEQADDFG